MVLSLFALLGLTSTVVAQHRRWRSIQGAPLTKFDGNCAETSWHPGRQLNNIVQAALRRNDLGPPRYADRAFAFDLNGDRRDELFVPLTCGGTGNCWWAVLSTKPARLLGTINGEYIYVHRRQGRWPIIITYGHVTAVEGTLTTYRYRNYEYLPLGKDYAINHGTFDLDVQGGRGHKMPSFLKRARAACKTVGY